MTFNLTTKKSFSWGFILAVSLLMLSLLFPGKASAAPDFGFTPSCSDRSYSDYLVPIFGGLMSCGGSAVGSGGAAAGNGSGSAFQSAVGVLNAAALILGAALATYIGLVGTMQTAHDGEILGKKMNSASLPIRTSFGFALVVPIAKGYCVAQLLVAFIAGQGIGLANSIWTTYLGKFTSAQGMAPTQRMPQVTELARNILSSSICVQAFNKFQADPNSSIAQIYPDPMSITVQGANTIKFGLPNSTSVECGKVFFRGIVPSNIQTTGLGSVMASAAQVDPTSINNAQWTAVQNMINTFNQTASKIVNYRDNAGQKPDLAADFNAAITAYQNTVAQAASSDPALKSTMQTFFQTASQDGWYLAGAWFMKAAALQDRVNQAVANIPTISPVDPKLIEKDTTLAQVLSPYFTTTETLLNTDSSAAVQANGAGAASSGLSQLDSSSLSSITSPEGYFASKATSFNQYVLKAFNVNPNRSAIMSVKDIGDYVMTASETLSATGMTLVIGSSFLKGGIAGTAAKLTIGDFAPAFTFVGYLFIAVGSIFFALGAAIAIYLPMSPFLLFFGAFVGYLILFAEAVLAAPLWAIFHLTPSGDDYMGGAKQGYMLILGLAFRPAFIILGYIFAISALDVIIQGFNGVFFPAFTIAMTGSLMGIGTLIVMLGIYFSTVAWLFHTVLGLIHVIPDKTLRYIGGGHENIGQSAQGINKASEQGSDVASRHADSVRQNVMTAGQSASNVAQRISADKRAQEDRQQQQEQHTARVAQERQAAQENAQKTAQVEQQSLSGEAQTSKLNALQANSKADSSESSYADKQKAIQANLNAGDSAEKMATYNARQNYGDDAAIRQMTPEARRDMEATIAKAGLDARKPFDDKAYNLANDHSDQAMKQADPSSLKSELDYNHARDALLQAANSQDMVGNSAKSAELRQKASELIYTPPKKDSSDSELPES